jgi:hypothetical protein
MATITVPVLTITNVNATEVSLEVKYTLTPGNVEKLAGTVFKEVIDVMGDDLFIDTTVTTFIPANFSVNTGTVNVPRSRTVRRLKSQLNEDPLFETNGSQQPDEIFARVTITYAAAVPVEPTLPLPGKSNIEKGAWK